MEEWAREGERIDDLQHDGLRILQRPGAFRFGTDAVLLADFAAARPGEHVVDFGTGTGILPLLIASRARGTTFDALEIQPDMADMAARSVAMNGLSDRIRVHCADLRDAASLLGHGRTDLLVCNPPYGKAGAGLVNPRQEKPRRCCVAAGACASCFPWRACSNSWTARARIAWSPSGCAWSMRARTRPPS